jgi:hypothetical protein
MLKQCQLPKVSAPVCFMCLSKLTKMHPSRMALCATFVAGLRAELARKLTASPNPGRMKKPRRRCQDTEWQVHPGKSTCNHASRAHLSPHTSHLLGGTGLIPANVWRCASNCQSCGTKRCLSLADRSPCKRDVGVSQYKTPSTMTTLRTRRLSITKCHHRL